MQRIKTYLLSAPQILIKNRSILIPNYFWRRLFFFWPFFLTNQFTTILIKKKRTDSVYVVFFTPLPASQDFQVWSFNLKKIFEGVKKNAVTHFQDLLFLHLSKQFGFCCLEIGFPRMRFYWEVVSTPGVNRDPFNFYSNWCRLDYGQINVIKEVPPLLSPRQI